MTEPTQLLYLEPDDEITSVVRRLGEAPPGRVILVAPGRTRATSSAIGTRLLARRAAAAGREILLVADAAGRALATEAGIAAFPTIAAAEGSDGSGPVDTEPAPHPRAAIHVVRGERLGGPTLSGLAPGLASLTGRSRAPGSTGPAAGPPAPMAAERRLEATQPVQVVAAPTAGSLARRPVRMGSLRWTRTTLGVVAAAVLLAGGAVAAVLPAATVHLVPATTPVGPVTYRVSLPGTPDSGTLQSTKGGTATGTYDKSTPARGTVTFANYGAKKVQVPRGTPVSAGNIVFTTDVSITVPGAHGIDNASTAEVAATAKAVGPSGNVETGAIDTVNDSQVRSDLCAQFLFCTRRLVANRQPMAGGATVTGPQVTQKDVDAVVAAIQEDLAAQLAAHLRADSSRIYAVAPADQVPAIDVPKDLVGKKDTTSFELSGQLDYDRRYVAGDALTEAVLAQLRADPDVVPPGSSLLDSSVTFSTSGLTASGDTVSGAVVARAATARQVDEDGLKARIAGQPKAEAEAALSDLGHATIDLWPGWVDSVPRLGFRVTVTVEAPSPSASASPAP